MKDFELKLGSTTYIARGNSFSKDGQSWNIHAKFHDLSIDMGIPATSKVPMEKILIFITAFDETLKNIQQEKNKNYHSLTSLRNHDRYNLCFNKHKQLKLY